MSRTEKKFAIRVEEGLAWLHIYGPDYGFDVKLVNLETLDQSSTENDVLSQSFTGFTVPWRDKFNQACDRLVKLYPTSGAMEQFLYGHGFDLPNVTWFQQYVLLQGDGEDEWGVLTEAWRAALTTDGAWQAARALRDKPVQP